MKRRVLTQPLALWLMLAVLAPSVLILGLVTCFMYTAGVQVLDRVAEQRAMDTVRFLAPASEYSVLTGSRDSLDSLMAGLDATPNLAAIAILDQNCIILAKNGQPRDMDSKQLCHLQDARVLSNDTKRLVVASPVRSQPVRVELTPEEAQRGYDDAARIVGWVYVEFDTTGREARKQEVLWQSLGLALLGLVLTALFAMALARGLSRPICRIAHAVKQMQQGDLRVRINEQAFSAELATLEQGFNAMAASIANNQEQLQQRIDEATRQLSWQAHHDPLTGLANRRRFEQVLDDMLAHGLRQSDQAALCFIDLDHFKLVNDNCGHPAGDALLKEVAHLIAEQVREDDLVCRVGGDEFAVILRHCPLDNARRVAEAIRLAVADYRYNCEGRNFTVGTSIGLVPLVGGGLSRLGVMMAADTACYSAKKSGRNRVVEISPEEKMTEVQPETHKDLNTILREQRLRLHVQGIFTLAQPTQPLYREVLLRYVDQTGEAQSPLHILAAIDREGLALELDEWVAKQACAALAAMRDAGDAAQSVPLFLNLSRASLQHAEVYLDALDAARRAHSLRLGQIGLEMHMSMAEQVPSDARRFARLARERGYPLVLEHFDSGSVTRIGSLHPDFLKVMVSSVCANPMVDDGMQVMRALVLMARALGIQTIIAGVESSQQRERVAESGAELAQGDALEVVHALVANTQ